MLSMSPLARRWSEAVRKPRPPPQGWLGARRVRPISTGRLSAPAAAEGVTESMSRVNSISKCHEERRSTPMISPETPNAESCGNIGDRSEMLRVAPRWCWSPGPHERAGSMPRGPARRRAARRRCRSARRTRPSDLGDDACALGRAFQTSTIMWASFENTQLTRYFGTRQHRSGIRPRQFHYMTPLRGLAGAASGS